MSILILGATGFLGPHVTRAAFASAQAGATFANPKGEAVVGVGRATEWVPRFTTPRDGPVYQAVDISSESALAGLLDTQKPRMVVNCAAMARVSACEQDRPGAERLNTGVPEQVAHWCEMHGSRLVHVSTDLVFGCAPAPRGGFTEACEPGPVSVYGHTKLAGERAVLAACPGALVVRLPLLYGNSGGRGLGASDSLLQAIDQGETPRLFIDEYRTPLEVENVGRVLVELADLDCAGVLHLGGPDRVSRHGLGLAVLDAMGLKFEAAVGCVESVQQGDLPDLGERPQDVGLACSAALALLQTPLLGVKAGMAQAVR